MMNQTQITAAASIARARTNNKLWLSAIDRAVSESPAWVVTEHHDHILITSNSGETYRVNGHCSCRAGVLGKPCKHLAYRRLAEIANDLPQVVATNSDKGATRDEMIAEIKSTFAKNHPGFYLADTVQRLCGPYSLEMLGVANLNYVLNAIA